MSNHCNCHNFRILLFIVSAFLCLPNLKAQSAEYPRAQISNKYLVMKLYLPDVQKGYYRATRFDWSGIIYSMEVEGHQFFGEWNKGNNPLNSEHVTGPAEAFDYPGLGYDDASPGEEFIRIGIGSLKKTQETEYKWNKLYKILDSGVWKIEQGIDWIEFRQELSCKSGWGYIYIKRIELMNDMPGFLIKHTLKNTGTRAIETSQFNHNFFVIDHTLTGPDFEIKFPFNLSTENKSNGIVNIDGKKLSFNKQVNGEFVWFLLEGFGQTVSDHQFEVVNHQTGAGIRVKVDKPLSRLVFWASNETLCPENYINIKLAPGEEETWISEYKPFFEK
jgi:hypothetical protein